MTTTITLRWIPKADHFDRLCLALVDGTADAHVEHGRVTRLSPTRVMFGTRYPREQRGVTTDGMDAAQQFVEALVAEREDCRVEVAR